MLLCGWMHGSVVVRACSLTYTAYKAHAPYCVIHGLCHIISAVVCMAPPYVSKLSHIRHDFRKNVIEHKTVFCFSL
jgi:hypothetical protein